MYLRDHYVFETLWSSVGIALYKSAPLLLTVVFLWRHHARAVRQLFESGVGPPSRIGSAAPGRADMKRVLIIPAAGRGTRLGWDGPKALCPVAGRPMIDHLFERYRAVVDRFIVVAAPSALSLVEQFLERASYRADAVVQEHPTGMLPAVLCARSVVETTSRSRCGLRGAIKSPLVPGRCAGWRPRSTFIRMPPWSSQP